MTAPSIRILFAAVALIGLAFAVWLTQDSWREALDRSSPAPGVGLETEHSHAHGAKDRIQLSPQASANLGLIVRVVQPQAYWRTVQIPGTVVERRGKSDRGVTAPIAGVVRSIYALPGDTIAPGAELFSLRLTSEYLHTSQTELSKIVPEIKLVEAERKRVEPLVRSGALQESKLIEVNNQLTRLDNSRKAQRSDLALRGLTAEQIDHVEQGQFLKEIAIRAPLAPSETSSSASTSSPTRDVRTPGALYEMEDLKVQLGEQVQAGQLLCYLADHQFLYIEGRGFKEDASLLARTVEKRWPVTADFMEEAAGDWPTPAEQPQTIQYLANTIDPASQTFPFFVPLTNQRKSYQQEGRTYQLWRFRPGQRVRLGVRVEQLQNVFVLPFAAVVREGADAYVFRQNGELFDRKPVHVIYEDATHVILANDGSITPGSYLAHNAAAALNRVLKAAEGGGGNEHDHAGHNH